MTAPVSVVIPVGRADDAFDAQLRALRSQHVVGADDLGTAELVVAANGMSAPALTAASAELRSPWPSHWTVRVVDASDVAGPSHARNVGWRSAVHDVVLFCDADDLVEPGWLAAMRAGVAEHGICGGRLAYDALNPPVIARRVTASTRSLPVKFHHLPYTPSCSLGISRALLEAVDGFDETLHCGEDIDLCWRVARAGAVVGFVPEAVLQYRLRADARGALRQAFRYACDDARLLRAHRADGARWTAMDSVRESAAVGKAVLLMASGQEARITAASRVGAFGGRLVGSVRHRVAAF